jgi:pyridoxal phosphate enzyme (YggS family)
MITNEALQKNYENVHERIKLSCKQYECSRFPEVLAVSKSQSIASIDYLYNLGHRKFAENYVQEALQKQQDLCHLFEIEWYFIGPVQSNKVKHIANHFDWVLSLDRISIADKLNLCRAQSHKKLNVCIQINIDRELTKSGVLPEEALVFAQYIQTSCPFLILRGMMAIPLPQPNILEQRHSFALLRELFNEMKVLSTSVDTLSMGMSSDLEAAIAEGSTQLRVGTALFGAR